MEKDKKELKELSTSELYEINGGGPIGRLIGWIGGIFRKSAEVELEVHGYINPTWR